MTLGFGEIVRVILQGTREQFYSGTQTERSVHHAASQSLLTRLGGALGFIGIPTYSTVFWVWTAVIITLAATIRLKLSSYGRALLTVREDEIAAQAMGVDVTRYKVRAFMFSAFFAGVAGALYALQIGSINAGELAFQKSFDIIIMVVLGGLGSISGAALAAIILTLLPELLRDPADIWPWGAGRCGHCRGDGCSICTAPDWRATIDHPVCCAAPDGKLMRPGLARIAMDLVGLSYGAVCAWH